MDIRNIILPTTPQASDDANMTPLWNITREVCSKPSAWLDIELHPLLYRYREWILPISLLVLSSLFLILTRKKCPEEPSPLYKNVETTKDEAESPHTLQQRKRKEDFLRRAGNEYGYASSPAGFIDDWRQEQFPNLISPLPRSDRNKATKHSSANIMDQEREVYLDYAGSALPSRSLLQAIHTDELSSSSILANPHSSGPAAARTSRFIEEAKKQVLDHFNGHPGRFASAAEQAFENKDSFGINTLEDWFHPGYDVLFTSGTTESLRVVAEHFPWSGGSAGGDGSQSILLYPHNAHTSVVGMRGPVLAQGGNFLCRHLDEIMQLADENDNNPHHFDGLLSEWGFKSQRESNVKNANEMEDHKATVQKTTKNLLVVPAECNFGGERPDVTKLLKAVRRRNEGSDDSYWASMLDLAKAAGTGPVNLKDLDPDFACISLYKMFGAPTGLGVLFVKRTATKLLVRSNAELSQQSIHRYFGGGSVDVVLAKQDFAVGRGLGSDSTASPSFLKSLSHGTVHFRGIASLRHGFDDLDRIGGMQSIQQHTLVLAKELTRCLKLLRHGNGQLAIRLYGAWGKLDQQSPDQHSGPTVAFNIVRKDGEIVGYNEVSKLAALNHPPLQLRTGCFCNPGACQEALKISDEIVIENYRVGGHICGDHNDIVDGKPTGAIRASFGKESIWEDLDALVVFLQRHFLDSNPAANSVRRAAQSGTHAKALLEEMYIFPIKSCAAQRVPKWKINTQSGRLLFDREFALVDSFGTAMRLQKFPKMGTIKPVVDLEQRTLRVTAPEVDDLVLDLDERDRNNEGINCVVSVCGNKCSGKLWGDIAASEWFSAVLGVQCWLARYSAGGYYTRQALQSADGLNSPKSLSSHAFANEKPILLISKHAVDELNTALVVQKQPTVSSRHFRPNFVVQCRDMQSDLMAVAHPEDTWEKIEMGKTGLELHACGHCARCAMVDIDPSTGTKGRTLRALADYRRKQGNINFGIFLQAGPSPGASSFKEEKEVCVLEEGIELYCK